MNQTFIKYLTVVILVCFVVSCKKTNEAGAFVLDNGIIGLKASNGAEFAIDPGNENLFVYKNSKTNQTFYTFSTLNSDQSKLYVQRRDSARNFFIDEISTYNGKTLRSIPYSIVFYDMVFDAKENRLFGLLMSASNTCDIYALNLSSLKWEDYGKYVKEKLFAFSGKSFMRNDKMFIVSYNDIFCFNPQKKEMTQYFTIGQNFDSEYDSILDCLYIIRNVGGGFTLSKFDFNSGKLEDLLTIPDISDIIQSSLCLKMKSNELVFYTYSNKRITLSLDNLKMQCDFVPYSILTCHSLHNNVEISLKDIK